MSTNRIYGQIIMFTAKNAVPIIQLRAGANEQLLLHGSIDGSLIGAELTDGKIIIGDVNNTAQERNISGDATVDNLGELTLSGTGVIAGSYTNTDLTVDSKGRITSAISGSGAISTTLPSTNILVGNSLNIAQARVMSGDSTINDLGVLTLADTTVVAGTYIPINLIVDSKGRLTSVDDTLLSARFIIGDGTNKASKVVMSGDASMNNLGVLSIATQATLSPSGGTFLCPTTFTFNEKGILTAFSTPVQILNGDGTVLLPSYSFSADPNTGMYRVGADQIGFASGGVLKLTVNTNGLEVLGRVYNGGGSTATPAYTFHTETDLGMCRINTSNLGFSVLGINRLSINTTAITTTLPILNQSGTALAPSYSFATDLDSGMYSAGANSLGLSLGGSARVVLDSNNLSSTLKLLGPDGDVNFPAHSFVNNPTTGFYLDAGVNDMHIAIAGILQSSFRTDRTSFFTPIRAVTGSASLPGISFTASSSTGMWYAGTSTIALTTNGTDRLTINTAGITAALPILANSGGVGAPAISFSGDPNTGIYNVTTDTLGVSTNGTLRLSVSTSEVTSTLPYVAPLGTASAPSFTFSTDTDTGIYRIAGGDNISFAVSTANVLTLTNNSCTSAVQIFNQSGTNTYPAYSFTTDSNTGFYNSAAKTISVTTNGTESLKMGTGGIQSVFGTNTAPGFSFLGRTDVGMYSSASSTLGLAVNSNGRILIGSGGANAAEITMGQGVPTLSSSDANGTCLLVRGNGLQSPLQCETNSTAAIYFTVFRSGSGGGFNCGFIQSATLGTTCQYLTASDERLKEDIKPMTGCLNLVKNIGVKNYKWKSVNARSNGLIAQELLNIYPEAVNTPMSPTDMYMIDYGKLTVPLIGAIKELSVIVDGLKAELEAQRAEMLTIKLKFPLLF